VEETSVGKSIKKIRYDHIIINQGLKNEADEINDKRSSNDLSIQSNLAALKKLKQTKTTTEALLEQIESIQLALEYGQRTQQQLTSEAKDLNNRTLQALVQYTEDSSRVYLESSIREEAKTLEEIENKISSIQAMPASEQKEAMLAKWMTFKKYVGDLKESVTAAELSRSFVLIESMSNDISTLKENLDDIKKQYNSILSVKEDLLLKLQNATREKDDLEVQIQNMKTTPDKVVQDQLDALKKQVEDKNEQLKTAYASLNASQQLNDQNEKLLKDKTENLKTIQDLLSSVVALPKDADLTLKSQKLDDLLSKLKASKAPELEGVISVITAAIQDIKNSATVISTLNAKKSDLEKQIDELKKNGTASAKTVVAQQAKVDVLAEAKKLSKQEQAKLALSLGYSMQTTLPKDLQDQIGVLQKKLEATTQLEANLRSALKITDKADKSTLKELVTRYTGGVADVYAISTIEKFEKLLVDSIGLTLVNPVNAKVDQRLSNLDAVLKAYKQQQANEKLANAQKADFYNKLGEALVKDKIFTKPDQINVQTIMDLLNENVLLKAQKATLESKAAAATATTSKASDLELTNLKKIMDDVAKELGVSVTATGVQEKEKQEIIQKIKALSTDLQTSKAAQTASQTTIDKLTQDLQVQKTAATTLQTQLTNAVREKNDALAKYLEVQTKQTATETELNTAKQDLKSAKQSLTTVQSFVQEVGLKLQVEQSLLNKLKLETSVPNDQYNDLVKPILRSFDYQKKETENLVAALKGRLNVDVRVWNDTTLEKYKTELLANPIFQGLTFEQIKPLLAGRYIPYSKKANLNVLDFQNGFPVIKSNSGVIKEAEKSSYIALRDYFIRQGIIKLGKDNKIVKVYDLSKPADVSNWLNEVRGNHGKKTDAEIYNSVMKNVGSILVPVLSASRSETLSGSILDPSKKQNSANEKELEKVKLAGLFKMISGSSLFTAFKTGNEQLGTETMFKDYEDALTYYSSLQNGGYKVPGKKDVDSFRDFSENIYNALTKADETRNGKNQGSFDLVLQRNINEVNYTFNGSGDVTLKFSNVNNPVNTKDLTSTWSVGVGSRSSDINKQKWD
jgi:hypothetical protein